jgi:hypothetical protein
MRLRFTIVSAYCLIIKRNQGRSEGLPFTIGRFNNNSERESADGFWCQTAVNYCQGFAAFIRQEEDDMPDTNDPSKSALPPGPPVTRKFGIAVLMLVGLYTLAVLLGLKPERRIDATTLGIIGLGVLIAAVLFRPDIVDRISHVEIAGWKVEIEKKKKKQDRQLQDIEIILAILLTEAEQKHLLNLAGNNTANYDGSHILRTELRHSADGIAPFGRYALDSAQVEPGNTRNY